MNVPTLVPEADRLAALARYNILDTEPEAAFERITSLAAHLFGVPIARISFVDASRVWFKSSQGTSDATTSRDHATCAYTILSDEVFTVCDAAADPRFSDHPLVKSEPDARFYAGAPLHTAAGFNLGVLCLIDFAPREFTLAQQESLKQLAAVVVDALETRLAIHQLAAEAEARQRTEAQLAEQVRLTAMGAEIGLTLIQHDLLTDVLHRCAEVLVLHLDAAFARVWTLNETTNVLELQASAGLYTHLDGPHSRVPVGKFKIGLIAQERLPHLTNQVVGDPRVGDQEWAQQNGMVAFAGYPLIVEDRLVGVVALFSCASLSQVAFQALEAIANAMALGIQHRQAQGARARLAEEVHLLLESTSEGICGLDLDGRLVFINRCGAQMLGYPPEALVGQPMHQMVHHHYADGSPYALEDCPIHRDGQTGQSTRADDEVFWRRDGTAIPVEYSCAPILEDGHIRGSVITFSDIAARKEAETILLQTKIQAEKARDEADRANRAKSEFLSRMSHELRTPLNAILGFGQLLEMNDPTPKQQESISHVLSGGRHLLDLINEVLDIARIEAGNLELTLEPVHVATALEEIAALLRPLAAGRNIALHVSHAEQALDGASVKVDRQRFKQVLLNLISNAIKYNHPSGRVDLKCERAESEGRLRLSVQDTGPGISPEDLPKLFSPFERLSAKNSTVEGSGIGLTISKRLVQAMGGTIDVTSIMGQGSTFSLELPLSGAVNQVADGRSPSGVLLKAEPVAEPGKKTLLYVEDNASNLSLIEAILERHPTFELLSAINGRAGLAMARERRPDLILLDMHLPDLLGDAVLRALKKDDCTREIPVVMVSADATPVQIQRLLGLGATAYLTKPLKIPAFLRTLDEALALKA